MREMEPGKEGDLGKRGRGWLVTDAWERSTAMG